MASSESRPPHDSPPAGSPRSKRSAFGTSERRLALVLAIIAIALGLIAFVKGWMLGARAGAEHVMLFAGPACLASLFAILVERSPLAYASLVGAALGIIGGILAS